MWLNVCVGESSAECLRDDSGVLLARSQRWAVIYADLSKSLGPMRVDPTVSNVEREYLIGREEHTGDVVPIAISVG